jgi:tRNA(fMet)-specific endonuclease VapC
MTDKVLVDTDVLSAIMRGDRTASLKAKDYVAKHGCLRFSIITVYELLRGLKARDATTKIAAFRQLCDHNEVLSLTPAIVEVASSIYATLSKGGNVLDHADILIAASAIAEDCLLATNNVRNFDRIEGLRIDNWLA